MNNCSKASQLRCAARVDARLTTMGLCSGRPGVVRARELHRRRSAEDRSAARGVHGRSPRAPAGGRHRRPRGLHRVRRRARCTRRSPARARRALTRPVAVLYLRLEAPSLQPHRRKQRTRARRKHPKHTLREQYTRARPAGHAVGTERTAAANARKRRGSIATSVFGTL
jgi:hypothetical protein